MAEAVVDESQNIRFYCHSCACEIDRISSDFRCPRCLDGFIEELPPADPSQPPDDDDDGMQNVSQLANELINNPILSPFLVTAGARPGDAYPESNGGGGGGGGGGGARRSRIRHRDLPTITNFDTFLQDILITIGGGVPGEGAGHMFLMGNPGDYAWGREGLDTIVTQLLNQMDNTGPPPLEKERIAEIPRVPINAEQVAMKLQCSVCWEDYELGQQVRELSCTHVFHEGCIVPWLELHATCPICRQSLATGCGADQLPVNGPVNAIGGGGVGGVGGGNEQQRNSLSAAAQAVANTIRNVTAAIRSPQPPSGSSQETGSGGTMPPPSQDHGVAARANWTIGAPGSSTSGAPSQFSAFVPIIGGGVGRSSQAQPSTSAATSSSTPASNSDRTTTMDRRNGRYRDDDGNIDFDFD